MLDTENKPQSLGFAITSSELNLKKGTLLSMRSKILSLILGTLLLPVLALANKGEVTLKGYIVDKPCSAKIMKNSDPAASAKGHKECAKKCAKSGLGIVSDGKFTPFDTKGTKQATELLEKTSQMESPMVEVVGKIKKDGTLAVASIKEVQ
jgi:hypothetical protein